MYEYNNANALQYFTNWIISWNVNFNFQSENILVGFLFQIVSANRAVKAMLHLYVLLISRY